MHTYTHTRTDTHTHTHTHIYTHTHTHTHTRVHTYMQTCTNGAHEDTHAQHLSRQPSLFLPFVFFWSFDCLPPRVPALPPSCIVFCALSTCFSSRFSCSISVCASVSPWGSLCLLLVVVIFTQSADCCRWSAATCDDVKTPPNASAAHADCAVVYVAPKATDAPNKTVKVPRQTWKYAKEGKFVVINQWASIRDYEYKTQQTGHTMDTRICDSILCRLLKLKK
jgi:hypothetical protein